MAVIANSIVKRAMWVPKKQ